jgi:hypothetical protein
MRNNYCFQHPDISMDSLLIACSSSTSIAAEGEDAEVRPYA